MPPDPLGLFSGRCSSAALAPVGQSLWSGRCLRTPKRCRKVRWIIDVSHWSWDYWSRNWLFDLFFLDCYLFTSIYFIYIYIYIHMYDICWTIYIYTLYIYIIARCSSHLPPKKMSLHGQDDGGCPVTRYRILRDDVATGTEVARSDHIVMDSCYY